MFYIAFQEVTSPLHPCTSRGGLGLGLVDEVVEQCVSLVQCSSRLKEWHHWVWVLDDVFEVNEGTV